MPLSVEDAFASAPPAPRTSVDEVYGGRLSVDDAYGPAPPPKPGVLSRASAAVSKGAAWEGRGLAAGVVGWAHQVHGALDQLREDVNESGTEAMPLHGLKTAWDSLQALWAPYASGVDVAVTQPVQEAMQKVGDFIKKYAPEGKASQPGWKVTKGDVQLQLDNLKEQVSAAIQVLSAGALGGGPKGAPKAKLTTAEAVRAKEASEATETLKPLEKPRARIVGQTPEGKPRIRIQTPAETSAGVAQTMREIHTSPKSVAEPLPGLHPISQLYREWLGPQANTLHLMQGAYTRGVAIGAHQLLGNLIEGTREGYLRSFLTRLRSYVDDVPVNFVDQVVDRQSGESGFNWRGQYDTTTHQVDIKFDPQTTDMTRVLTHELTHAATHRFIITHPDHPLVQELEALLQEAQHRAKQNPAWNNLYGLSNRSEFVAEAMSKPAFQTFLTKSAKYASEGWKGAGDLFHELARIIQRMFGIPDGPEASLLHRSMYTSEQIMKAQKREKYSIIEDPTRPGSHLIEASPKDIKIPRIATDNPLVRKLGQWIDDAQRAVAPESRGEKAKLAGAVLAHRVTEYAQRQIAILKDSNQRAIYWFKNPKLVPEFLRQFESGKAFTNPALARLATSYKTWAEDIYKQDSRVTRLHYDPVDNYLPHVFEDRDADSVTNFFNERYGTRWGNPNFIRERGFSLIQEAEAAGFKLKYKTPEDMMLARKRASDIAYLQTQLLEDLWDYGVATLREKGVAQPKGTSPRRAPNGDIYYVDNKAFQVLHNYFDTRSLWSDKSIFGTGFRGAMWLKNGMVPIKLGLSGFHPLHIMLGIDNSAAIARSIEMAAVEGGIVRAPVAVLKSWLTNFAPWKSVSTNPYFGGRLIRSFDSQGAAAGLKDHEIEFSQRALEGGFNPHLHFAYQQAGIKTIRGELQRLGAQSAWRLPLAVINTLARRLMFEKWIPALKAQSYSLDVQAALKMDPTLLEDDARRIQRFTQIRKSVDNRYGEMNYDTLFWNRMLKDIGVLNTLSMGWQLGFIREFGGGTMDLAKYGAQLNKAGRVDRIAQGDLHKAIYSTVYLTNVALYAGLMTWAMTGKPPQSLEDYIFPRIGGNNPDGTPRRVTTMFYTREPAMIAAHVRESGVFGGLKALAESKSSGVIGALIEFGTGLNQFNQEYRDPNGTWQQTMQQTLAFALGGLEPISIQNLEGEGLGEKFKGIPTHQGAASRTVSGFTPAPRYITDDPVESEIKADFRKYFEPTITAYDKALYSKDYARVRKLYEAQDPTYEDALDKMVEDHDLTEKQRQGIERSLDDEVTPLQRMFGRLSVKQQKRLLDKMTPEKREEYLDHAHKILREEYEEPVK